VSRPLRRRIPTHADKSETSKVPGRVGGAARVAVASAPAAAAAKKSPKSRTVNQEEVYRCRDAKGQSYFGQNIPPECMDADVEVLDGSGRVVRVIPGSWRSRRWPHRRTPRRPRRSRRNAIERCWQPTSRSPTSSGCATATRAARAAGARDGAVRRQPEERETRLTEDVRRYRPYSDSPRAPVLPTTSPRTS